VPIASEIACESPEPPSEALTTLAPLSAAYVNASATSALVPVPKASSTRSGMIDACHATPATPTPLFPRAAIVPATCVP
jgi:hypothetical protein